MDSGAPSLMAHRNMPGWAGEAPMKLKLDANGNAVLQDGMPVYVHSDGKEVPFDAAGTVATISRLNGEAKSHRERYQTAEEKLKLFEGIEDPKKAMDALKTVSNLDAKKLVDAGEFEKVKTEITKSYEEKLQAEQSKAKKYESELFNERVGGAFSRSKYIGEKCAVPADMIQSRFGSNFKIEDGKIIGYDTNGGKIYSRARPGEVADFEEAIETLVGSYQYRDNILKAPQSSGAGAQSQNGGASPNAKTIKRADFLARAPAEQASLIKSRVTPID
jgi:hypothetical protein